MNLQQNMELVLKAHSDFKSGNIPALLEAPCHDVTGSYQAHGRGPVRGTSARTSAGSFSSPDSPNPRYLKNSNRKNSSDTKTRSSFWDVSGGR